MWKIAEQIKRAAAELHVAARWLETRDTEALRKHVRVRFAKDDGPDIPIWERLGSSFSVQSENGFKWISDYAKDKDCILFFNERDESTMFAFPRGQDIVAVLEGCTGFEFYVSDQATSFSCASIITIF